MNKDALGTLIALNGLLLVALLVAVIVPERQAQAQEQAQNRGPKNYIMVAGEVTGRKSQSAVYVLELTSMRMRAIMFDSRSNKLQPLGQMVNVGLDLASAPEPTRREDR